MGDGSNGTHDEADAGDGMIGSNVGGLRYLKATTLCKVVMLSVGILRWHLDFSGV